MKLHLRIVSFISEVTGLIFPLVSFDYGNSQVTYRTDGWVVITSDGSSDMLPITFCSEALIARVAEALT